MLSRPARNFCLALVMLCVCAFSAQAQDAAIEPPKQIQLSADMVKRYIVTRNEIKKWQAANETTSKTDDEEEAEEGGVDYGNATVLMQLAKNSPEVKTILQKNNFENVDKFGEVAQSVELAYYYADPESGLGPDYEANIRKSIEQVKNNKEISDEEKAESIKGLENDLAGAQKLKPLTGNVEVVTPYIAEIKKIEESE